ncbi:hypothetical protein SAMN06265182_1321 [Persephonella hydrogeniphila]|uniref:Uncharacterized protein n=1 Tax=Persephonella hydrogeniphila TaxID=198703 RepID=A0A285NGC6_9AQUI|nr:hypothetical protein [Persephonella hydrogeniphila]SNZ08505.1 hypothetical protein SAMN06265182_1321 [Persephonella hydrogeniphila]
MELWVNISGEKKKYQGSFKTVMESIYNDGKGKEVTLLSIHAPQKELRRFKREWRSNGKNLVETARKIAVWFYLKDYRRAKRCIREYRKKTDPVSILKVQRAQKMLQEVQPKLEALS